MIVEGMREWENRGFYSVILCVERYLSRESLALPCLPPARVHNVHIPSLITNSPVKSGSLQVRMPHPSSLDPQSRTWIPKFHRWGSQVLGLQAEDDLPINGVIADGPPRAHCR